MKYRIHKIGVWSAVKISFLINALLGACLGFFIGIMFFLFGALLARFSDIPGGPELGMPMIGGVAAIILMPIFYGFFLAVVNGIIVTAIGIWLYNIFSGLVGGVEMELDEIRIARTYAQPPPSPGQVNPAAPEPESPSPKMPPAGDKENDSEKPGTSQGGVDV
jgi:hypothetical protein